MLTHRIVVSEDVRKSDMLFHVKNDFDVVENLNNIFDQPLKH